MSVQYGQGSRGGTWRQSVNLFGSLRSTGILLVINTLSVFFTPAAPADALSPLQVGIYYYPGWGGDVARRWPDRGWPVIRPFQDRLPIRGEYSSLDVSTLASQAVEMRRAGIGFMVFDWYFEAGSPVRQLDAASAYSSLGKSAPLPFAVLVANHGSFPSDLREWDAFIDTLQKQLFSSPAYKKIGRRPQVFIFSPKGLEVNAQRFGEDTFSLFARARSRLQRSHIEAPYYVACVSNLSEPSLDETIAPYQAVTTYNYRRNSQLEPNDKGFSGLTRQYERQWQIARARLSKPYLLPLTVGWDRTPWGGSGDEDGALPPSGSDLQAHVTNALKTLHEFPRREDTAIICCWNEFGEGSFLEPTKGDLGMKLRAVQAALSGTKH